jgi:2-polyprenyl-3-methyl-5-hydroxy-6-metoxy-1,4-benzoquinol methylase
MKRVLTPEWLDSLPPWSPEAVRSRRDLVRLNRIMGNPAWFARTAPPLARPGEQALELGAGDGTLSLSLRAAGLPVDALDRFPAPGAWPAAVPWHVTDLLQFGRWAEYPIVVGNLILHHLDAPALAALGAKLDQTARVLVFNEPLRHLRARLLWAVGAPLGGAGPVTRHDGRVSIEAGFRADELPCALGLAPARWRCRVSTTFLGAYRFVALRRP